jgi:UDP:flavonoid glycosyltransferase YjiC (YdhE family)
VRAAKALPEPRLEGFHPVSPSYQWAAVFENRFSTTTPATISHGNHSTACTLTLAGLPQLLIPRHQEQLLLACRLVAQGSALLAYQDQPGYAKEINALLTNPALRTNAATLAHTCRQRGDPDAKGYIRAALTDLLVEVSLIM